MIRPGRRGAQHLAAGAAIAALWFLSRQYRGIVHDSRIYVGRALADLDPAGYGRDFMFAFDRQTGWSVFRPLLREAVALIGADKAALVLTALGLALWLGAAWLLARQLARGPVRAGILALLAMAPATYGALNVFQFAEPFLTPRLYAEAFVIGGLALALDRRYPLAAAALALACIVHPIMGVVGVGAVAALLLVAHRRWRWLGLAAILIATGVVLLQPAALTASYYGLWRAVVRSTDYLFLADWTGSAWGLAICQGATLVLAATRLRGKRARLALAVLGVGAGGLVLSLAAVDFAEWRLLTQAQPWRAVWLAAAIAPLLLLPLYLTLRHTEHGRAAFAALLVAWWLASDPLTAGIGAGLALVLSGPTGAALAGRASLQLLPRAAAAIGAFQFGSQLGAGAIALWFGHTFGQHDLRWLFQAAFTAAGVAAILVSCGYRLPRLRISMRLAAPLATAAALLLFDNRMDLQRIVESGQLRAPDRIIAGHPGDVFLTDESIPFAYRPIWWSWVQSAPTAFSRELAVRWAARLLTLKRAGFNVSSPINATRFGRDPDGMQPTRPKLVRLCAARNAPAWVVTPLEPLDRATRALPMTAVRLPAPFPEIRLDRLDIEARRTLAFFDCRAIRAAYPRPPYPLPSAPAPSASGAAPTAPYR